MIESISSENIDNFVFLINKHLFFYTITNQQAVQLLHRRQIWIRVLAIFNTVNDSRYQNRNG